eukprot:7896386-Pyramimonas_sp.AAC.1
MVKRKRPQSVTLLQFFGGGHMLKRKRPPSVKRLNCVERVCVVLRREPQFEKEPLSVCEAL